MAELPEHVRRRIDEVFGDVLPATTSDERGDEPAVTDADEQQLLAERPPHHDQER